MMLWFGGTALTHSEVPAIWVVTPERCFHVLTWSLWM